MKNLTLILLLLVSSFTFSQQYEYKIISVIESVVPNGLGRSRMLSETQPVDYKSATTIRTEEGKQKSDKSRSEI